jgi:hypothetical protein
MPEGMIHQVERGVRGKWGIVVGVALGLLLSGCGEESDWAAPSAPTQSAWSRGVWVGRSAEAAPPQIIVTPAVAPKVHIFAGRILGYELTAEAPGAHRFRWTTDNLVHRTGVRRFTGSVYTPGHFLSFAPGCDDGSCDLEEGDYVSGVLKVPGGGERIEWDTLAKDGWDGFSFTIGDEPLNFQVNVDGRARPELFELVTWNNQPRPAPPAADSLSFSQHD